MAMVVVIAACSVGEVQPDVHFVGEMCDSSWGGAITSCEHACLAKPLETPHPGCTGAQATDKSAIDCTATFIAFDGNGEHLGCCQVRSDISMFYECPR